MSEEKQVSWGSKIIGLVIATVVFLIMLNMIMQNNVDYYYFSEKGYMYCGTDKVFPGGGIMLEGFQLPSKYLYSLKGNTFEYYLGNITYFKATILIEKSFTGQTTFTIWLYQGNQKFDWLQLKLMDVNG